MPTSSRRTARHRTGFAVALVSALSLLLWLPQRALASDDHDGREASKPAAKPAANENKAQAKSDIKVAAATSADPMELLREKLAQKLGAAKAPESANPYVLRVSSKADAGHAGEPADKPAAASRSRQPSAQALAAAPEKKAAAPDGHAAHWSYAGAGGPEQWGAMKPEFAKCASGTRQSPIDIRGGVQVDLDPVQFDYRPTSFRVIDNGHTVQVDVGPGNSIEVMGRRFDLLQFHFHRPSEERIDGRQFDMVAHLVHRDLDGRLAVVAVLLDRGSAHPLVQSVWNNLPLERGDGVAAKAPLDLNDLLPKDRRYFTYMGSLTTPPCSEGVLWMVMKQPVPIAAAQIDVFARLYPMNARPIQSASDRLIKHSN